MEMPFLENPRRRRRRGHKRGCRCAVHGGRRRSRRRNPGGVIYNPRKRRKARRGGHRRHSRRYARNPGGRFLGQFKGIVPKLGWGAVGAIGAEAVPTFAARFVPMPAGRVGQIGVKLGSGLAVAWLVKRFVGRAQGNAALVGAFLPPVIDTFRAYVGPMIGLGGYLPSEVGAYALPEYAPLAYLGPGSVLGQYEEEEEYPDRLSPDDRL